MNKSHSYRVWATIRTAIISVLVIAGMSIQGGRLPALVQAESEHSEKTIPGVRFAGEAGTQYVEIRAIGEALDWPVRWDKKTQSIYLKDQKVAQDQRRALPDGTQVIPVRALKAWDAQVGWDREARAAYVQADSKRIVIPTNHLTVMDGVTFAGNPGALYVPIRQLGRALGKRVVWNKETDTLYWNDKPVAEGALRTLPDGTQLIALNSLRGPEGVTVSWKDAKGMARVDSDSEGRIAWVRKGEKRVAVSINAQRMRAWQGRMLVLDTRVSTGRPGHATPRGRFTAGPLKTPLIISRKYNNARMPWSVQIRGDVVIHGYTSVPPQAASHGCVRVPLTGANPAKWFYDWIDVGTPIVVRNGWPSNTPAS